MCKCIRQTDVEFKKEQRVLGMKQKNNFLAHANLRETEHMAKRTRLQSEPSELRYQNHLQDIQTPQKEMPNATKCESEANSMKNTSETPKKEEDESESLVDPEPADVETTIVAKRKGFLSFLV